MIFVDGKKFACLRCIRGHRSSSCSHSHRPLIQVRRRGRPVTNSKHRAAILPDESCKNGVSAYMMLTPPEIERDGTVIQVVGSQKKITVADKFGKEISLQKGKLYAKQNSDPNTLSLNSSILISDVYKNDDKVRNRMKSMYIRENSFNENTMENSRFHSLCNHKKQENAKSIITAGNFHSCSTASTKSSIDFLYDPSSNIKNTLSNNVRTNFLNLSERYLLENSTNFDNMFSHNSNSFSNFAGINQNENVSFNCQELIGLTSNESNSTDLANIFI